MAASVQDSISKGIDSSVGGLVWVQRRNGRWWPGMIIGPDHLLQQPSSWPRSRTPVKLLGREDAIGRVDWYNIEKSKRVKAFRCGEYDEWITKAKDSPKNSNKKAMKHVCRDDAIRHALKLEKTFISKKDEDICSTNDHDHITESVNISPSTGVIEPTVDKIRIFDNNSNNTQELCVSSLSFEDPRQVNSTSGPLVHGNLQNISCNFKEDEAKITPKISDIKIPKDSFLHSNLDMENSSIQSNGGCKDESSPFKRKRPALVSVKRRNRHRPLTKVLESANEVHVSVMCDITRSSNQSEYTGLSENNEGAIRFSRSKCSSMSVSCNNLHKRKLIFNSEALNGEIRGPETSHDNQRLKDQNILSSLKIQEEGLVGTLFDVPFAQKEDESDETCTPFSDILNIGGKEEECWGEKEDISPVSKSGIVTANWKATRRRKSRRRQCTDAVTLIPHAYFVGADHWDDLSPLSTSNCVQPEPVIRGSAWLWDVVVAVGPTPVRSPLTAITTGVKGDVVVGHGLAVEVVGSNRGGDEVPVVAPDDGGCVRVRVVFERLMKCMAVLEKN